MVIVDDYSKREIECCYIAVDDATKLGCTQGAIAMISDEGHPYEVTYACGDHIDEMRELPRDWLQLGDGRYFAPGVKP